MVNDTHIMMYLSKFAGFVNLLLNNLVLIHCILCFTLHQQRIAKIIERINTIRILFECFAVLNFTFFVKTISIMFITSTKIITVTSLCRKIHACS